jgi:uncharacterized alpha-E superfamily protein
MPRSLQERLTLLEDKVAQLEASPVAGLRDEMRAGFAEVTRQLQALEQRFEQRLEQGLEETRRHARVLYEDLVTRIATIGEGGPPSRRRVRRKP